MEKKNINTMHAYMYHGNIVHDIMVMGENSIEQKNTKNNRKNIENCRIYHSDFILNNIVWVAK